MIAFGCLEASVSFPSRGRRTTGYRDDVCDLHAICRYDIKHPCDAWGKGPCLKSNVILAAC